MKEEIEYLEARIRILKDCVDGILYSGDLDNPYIKGMYKSYNNELLNLKNILKFIKNNTVATELKYKQGQLVYISLLETNGKIISIQNHKTYNSYIIKPNNNDHVLVDIPEKYIEEYKE